MNLAILALGFAVMGVSIGEGIWLQILPNQRLVSLKCLANCKH